MQFFLVLLTIMVVPVSTRSMTASASPRPHAASTEPDTYLMPRNNRKKKKNKKKKRKIRRK